MVEVVRGRGTLLEATRSIDAPRCVILTGRTSYAASGAASALAPLTSSGARHLEVAGPLPSSAEVDAIVARIGRHRPTTVIGVGGGLVIDTMKAVALSIGTGKSSVELIGGDSARVGEMPATMAVPTTSGSGAERTPFAVIYRHGVKYSIDDDLLLPGIAVIDPNLTRSVPRHIAAAAALDAVAHCVESVWSRRSTAESRATALSALARISKHIEPAILDGSEDSQDELMYAASDAGAAISVTRTTAAHALSYHLTSVYRIAHGHAVALVLGLVASFNESVDHESNLDDRGIDHVRSTVNEGCLAFGASSAGELKLRLHDLMRRMGLNATVDGAASGKVDRNVWAADVNVERLGNNPRRFDKQDLMRLVGEA